MPKKVKREKSQILGPAKFFRSPVRINKRYISVKLPLSVAEYLELKSGKLCWIPLNGVIQLSGSQPRISIPSLNLTQDSFVSK